MNSAAINLADVAHISALNNEKVQGQLVKQLFKDRIPMFTSFLYDKRQNCILFVLYYGPGSDYLYSPDIYSNNEAYDYVELIYDKLNAITEAQAFALEREIRKFTEWHTLKKHD